MQILFGRKIRFQKNDFTESSDLLENPGTGWYHVYSFEIGALLKDTLKEAKGSLATVSSREQLVLVRINIGAFRGGDISKEGLSYIERILELFHIYGKQIILRFAYDTEGKGMEREPKDASLVIRHMEQLGDIICGYAQDILVLQGIFVGNWGEMHGSKFLDVLCMSKLLCSLNSAVKERCYLAVRTPAQWRAVMSLPMAEKRLKGRVALFNDGLFGSSTDLGTYGEDNAHLPDRCGRMGRSEELRWQREHMENLPNGGEAVGGERIVGYLEAVKEMKELHLSYLNSVWRKDQLEYWREEKVEKPGCFYGLSGYEYIGRHLGYRFVIRDAKLLSGRKLSVEVENCGFAGLCEETECMLIVEDGNGSMERRLLDIDARSFKSGQKTKFAVPFTEVTAGRKSGRVYLRLQRKRDGRNIYFANQEPSDMVLLGEFHNKGFFEF